jgi:hypothetical protein
MQIENIVKNKGAEFIVILIQCLSLKQLIRSEKKKERIPYLSVTLRYRVLSGDSFESPIFFLQLLLAAALDRRPV